jgi:hypothetical protein
LWSEDVHYLLGYDGFFLLVHDGFEKIDIHALERREVKATIDGEKTRAKL